MYAKELYAKDLNRPEAASWHAVGKTRLSTRGKYLMDSGRTNAVNHHYAFGLSGQDLFHLPNDQTCRERPGVSLIRSSSKKAGICEPIALLCEVEMIEINANSDVLSIMPTRVNSSRSDCNRRQRNNLSRGDEIRKFAQTAGVRPSDRFHLSEGYAEKVTDEDC